jgi:uncharacterized membrane protein
MSSPAPVPALRCNYCSCPPQVDPGCPPNNAACANPCPAQAVIPTDTLGRIKYFLQLDGPNCEKESRDSFATFLTQSGFSTVTKPGTCPSGTKLFPSPSAGDTSYSEALPYVVCRPDNFDMGFSSAYHSYQGNYINCTQSEEMGIAGTIVTVIIAILVSAFGLFLLYLLLLYWGILPPGFKLTFGSG